MGLLKKILKILNLLELAKSIRKWYWQNVLLPCDYKKEQVSGEIAKLIKSNDCFMISRLGMVELGAMLNIKKVMDKKTKFDKNNFFNLQKNAGFFPLDQKNIEKYYDRMYSDIQEVDLLGQFSTLELNFKKELKNSKKVWLSQLEPYYFDNPWSKELEGKKVLVIYPFESSIKKQYGIREKLFENKNVLPKFELKTLKSVQSLGGEKTKYLTWFDALHSMEKKIDKIDFDVAIIGCGAYGLPLAAYIKRKGKQAIHLGGATQILFGVKGKRWEDRKLKYINKYWINPDEKDKPKNFKKVENGCYW